MNTTADQSEDYDFLAPHPPQIRHQIQGILDSYSHEWDLIAELCQNAIDAIRARVEGTTEKGHVSLTVNGPAREIVISDNGTGIPYADLPTLLRPFSTNKGGRPNQIGSKGVGLAFIIFSSSSFEIATNSGDDKTTAIVTGAAEWVATASKEMPRANLSVGVRSEQGTQIRLTISDDEHPIFDLSDAELEFIVRTKTALGDTGYVWDTPLDCDFELVHISKDGKKTSKELECQYLLPVSGLKRSDTLSLDEFKEWMTGDRSDAEKRRKLKDKLVYNSEWKTKNNRTIRWWSCSFQTDLGGTSSIITGDSLLHLQKTKRYLVAHLLGLGAVCTHRQKVCPPE